MKYAKNELSLYGRFVYALRDHLERVWGRMEVHQLVQAMTGAPSRDKSSRFLHYEKPSRHPDLACDQLWSSSVHNPRPSEGLPVDIAWYHDRTIGAILKAAFVDTVDEDYLEGALSRGHYVGSRSDWGDLYAVRRAILVVALSGGFLPIWLERAPLVPDCVFCRTMYEAYDKAYHQGSGILHTTPGNVGAPFSDLEREVRALGSDADDGVRRVAISHGWKDMSAALARSLAIYVDIFLRVLMGPDSLRAASRESLTPTTPVVSYKVSLTGFSLSQKHLGDGRAVLTDAAMSFVPRERFVVGRAPATGEEPGADVGYVTTHDDAGLPNCVSSEHVEIRPVKSMGRLSGWRLVHLSQTNVTAIRDVDSRLTALEEPGQGVTLHDGDEIWLAPVADEGGEWQRSFDAGAVLVFHEVYGYA